MTTDLGLATYGSLRSSTATSSRCAGRPSPSPRSPRCSACTSVSHGCWSPTWRSRATWSSGVPPIAGAHDLAHHGKGHPWTRSDPLSRRERRRPPMPVKIVIAGGFGVGKTTAVGAISEIPLLTTEAADHSSRRGDRPHGQTPAKTTTTVALDFGCLTIDDEHQALPVRHAGTGPLRVHVAGPRRRARSAHWSSWTPAASTTATPRSTTSRTPACRSWSRSTSSTAARPRPRRRPMGAGRRRRTSRRSRSTPGRSSLYVTRCSRSCAAPTIALTQGHLGPPPGDHPGVGGAGKPSAPPTRPPTSTAAAEPSRVHATGPSNRHDAK